MTDRTLLYALSGCFTFALLFGMGCVTKARSSWTGTKPVGQPTVQPSRASRPITLFLTGDVMTGRGIDQILPHPSDPHLHEPFMKSARGYVGLAVQANGPIQVPVEYAYIWGDALQELERVQPDLRIINLETSITTSDDYWLGKGIHYRMHPENIYSLTAAKIDFCSLANNHVLDWGYAGLTETLQTLQEANIDSAGAGRNQQHSGAPAVIDVQGKGRVILFSYGLKSSGIPLGWLATVEKPGVNLLTNTSASTIERIKGQIQGVKKKGDVVVASIHWGGNWGYEIPPEQRQFAYQLIDEAGVDLIHGHSSHHVKGIEVYKGKLIIYGAGDFLNDYEGISGYEDYRSDLALMYFASIDPSSGALVQLQMTPMQIKNFGANRASGADALWLRDTLNREGKRLSTQVEITPDNTLTLSWD